MDVAQRKFFIDIVWSHAWLLGVPVGLIWAYLWPWYLAAVYCSALLVLPPLLFLVVPSIEVGRDGMRLNRVRSIRWGDIAAVRYKRFLGLSYLKLRKRWGLMDWWLPLYVSQPRELRDAICEFAPPDSLMREAVESYYTQQSAAADAEPAGRVPRG